MGASIFRYFVKLLQIARRESFAYANFSHTREIDAFDVQSLIHWKTTFIVNAQNVSSLISKRTGSILLVLYESFFFRIILSYRSMFPYR